MPEENLQYPEMLSAFCRLDCHDFSGKNSVDFRPYDQFLQPEEASEWFRAWTGNAGVDAGVFKVFGQDSSGGLVAFWCVRKRLDLLEQPIVYMGSDEAAVVAGSFAKFLWLFAAGLGPCEIVWGPYSGFKNRPFENFAIQQVPREKTKKAAPLRAEAAKLTPEFKLFIDALTR